jgi:hypothetical protein
MMLMRVVVVLLFAGSAMAGDAGLFDGGILPDAAPDAAASPCGNGVLDQGERCDTAIASGSGACPTAPGCAALPPGSLGGGCGFYLTGSACDAHCVPVSYDCDGMGSGSQINPVADDDGPCSAGGSYGALAFVAIALVLITARRRAG